MHFCQLVQTLKIVVYSADLCCRLILMRFFRNLGFATVIFASLLEQVKKGAAFFNEAHFLQNILEWLGLLAEVNFDQLKVQ